MKGWMAFFLILLVVAALIGYGIAHNARNDPRIEAQAERIRMETARRDAEAAYWLPVKIFAAVLATALGVGAGVCYLYGRLLLARQQARTFYADANGVMPAIALQPGEILADAGALAGPLTVGPGGPTYTALPPSAVPQLQENANRGAGMSRSMRAWASRQPSRRDDDTPPAILQLAPGKTLPPVEQLEGDEGHVYRLLEDGER